MNQTAIPGTNPVYRCRRCNRALSDETSVAAGIGPICKAKEENPEKFAKPERRDPFDPVSMDITMRRGGKGRGSLEPTFNIEQRHRHHSPSGMEFGYGGSGPADLALNILALFMPVDQDDDSAVELWDKSKVDPTAYALHQEFKRTFIEPMNYLGGTITGRQVRAWIASNLSEMEVDE